MTHEGVEATELAPTAGPTDKASAPAAPRVDRGRAAGLMVAVFLLQAAFLASYVGGLHGPDPREVPIAVVAPPAQVQQLAQSLGPARDKVHVVSEPSEQAARRAITNHDVYAALVPAVGTSRLLVASAAGPAAAQFAEQVAQGAAASAHQQVQVVDVAPLPADDSRGLSSFYVVIGWLVGGYLVAAILGLFRGMTPPTARDAVIRLGGLAGYSLASGALGALIVVAWFGYLPDGGWAVAGIGSLLVFAVAAATTAAESIAGVLGTALAIVAFVVLGNPSAGGPWPIEMVPSPWREIGPWLPNGAAVTAVRQAVYFGGHALTVPLLVLAGYAVAGVLGCLLLSRRGRPLLDIVSAPGRAHA